MHAQQVMYVLLGKYVVKYLVALRAYGAKNLDKAYCKCSFNLFCIIKKNHCRVRFYAGFCTTILQTAAYPYQETYTEQ